MVLKGKQKHDVLKDECRVLRLFLALSNNRLSKYKIRLTQGHLTES